MFNIKSIKFVSCFKGILIYIGILIFFVLFMFLGCLIPSKYLEKHVVESSNIINENGLNNTIIPMINFELDNYTDSLMINEAYSVDNSNALYSAFAVRKNYKKNQTKYEEFDTSHELKSIGLKEYAPHTELGLFLDGKIDTSINYARYWHGYLPLLRVLLLFLNISEIRILFFIVFSFLLVIFFILLKKRLGLKYALIFSSALILSGYSFIHITLQNVPVFMVMIISSIILLFRIEKIKSFNLYIFIVGCFTNFFDYLTVPLITLGIPLYIYLIYNSKKEKFDLKKQFIFLFKASICWLIGYSFTWLAKWVLFDLFYDGNLIKVAFEQVFYRTLGDIKFGYESRTGILIMNLFYALYNIFLSSFFLVPFYLYLWFFKKKSIKKKYINLKSWIKNNILYFVILCFPFIWYIVLCNHSLSHYWFVCRLMMLFLIGFMLIITDIVCYDCKE